MSRTAAPRLLALRTLAWTALFPGVFAGWLPWQLGLRSVGFAPLRLHHLAGLVGIALGVAGLVGCILDFARRGKGTLAPVDEPHTLVVGGLYRYVRNPMYLSVATILLSEALLAASRRLLAYWAVFFAFANLFVLAYEEPHLRRRYGEAYARYCRAVGRWVPRLRSPTGA